jgi:hypothetical protein
MAKREPDAISGGENIIDVRDVIARVEYLESETEDRAAVPDPDDDKIELDMLSALLADLCGNGGNEQWRGDRYPITLVRDSYFETFAQEEAESLDLVKDDAQWPYTCIDWEKAAYQLQQDYSSVELNGETYWYNS